MSAHHHRLLDEGVGARKDGNHLLSSCACPSNRQNASAFLPVKASVILLADFLCHAFPLLTFLVRERNVSCKGKGADGFN